MARSPLSPGQARRVSIDGLMQIAQRSMKCKEGSHYYSRALKKQVGGLALPADVVIEELRRGAGEGNTAGNTADCRGFGSPLRAFRFLADREVDVPQ